MPTLSRLCWCGIDCVIVLTWTSQEKKASHAKNKELEASCVALDQANQLQEGKGVDKEVTKLAKAKDKLEVSAQKHGSTRVRLATVSNRHFRELLR